MRVDIEETITMHVIRVRNINEALPAGLAYLAEVGVPRPSRNGGVIVAPGPVTTVYERPAERVLFSPGRDANPFFHFFEALWMLAGRNDLGYLTQFVKRFEDYSDDGKTLAAAYGHRWRHWSQRQYLGDQLNKVVEILAGDPTSRRAVITMWDPARDLLGPGGKDLACNTNIFLTVATGGTDEPNRLNMMVNCRSNDLIWGACGANAVHFSVLQEYLAAQLGLSVGILWQNSWNYHAYKEIYDKTCAAMIDDPRQEPYIDGIVKPYRMVEYSATWDEDLRIFMAICDSYARSKGSEIPLSVVPYRNPFFHEVARPLWWAHQAHKRGAYTQAFEIMNECHAQDWQLAAIEWLLRRQASWQERKRTQLAGERAAEARE